MSYARNQRKKELRNLRKRGVVIPDKKDIIEPEDINPFPHYPKNNWDDIVDILDAKSESELVPYLQRTDKKEVHTKQGRFELPIKVWGSFLYRCVCGFKADMYLQEGVEGPYEKLMPSPNTIS